eukprot:tig00021434_g21357.t1
MIMIGFTYIALEKVYSIFSFLPLYVVRQILCRMVTTYILRVRRIVLKEFGSDGCAEIRLQRSLPFASGSAGVPLHWSSRGLSRSLGLSPAAEARTGDRSSSSPFVLHSCAPPRRAAPGTAAVPPREAREAPVATELFFDLVGADLERRPSKVPWSLDGGASWVAPTPLSPDSSPGLDDGSNLSKAGQPPGDDASGFTTYLNEALPRAASSFPGAPVSFGTTVLRESWRALKEEAKEGYRMRAAEGMDRTTPTPPEPPLAIVDAPPPAYVEDPNHTRKSRARRCSDALAEVEARTPRRVCTPPASALGPHSSPRAPAGFSSFLNARLGDAIKSQPGVPLGLIVDRLRGTRALI